MKYIALFILASLFCIITAQPLNAQGSVDKFTLLKDILPGDAEIPTESSNPHNLVSIGDFLLFSTFDQDQEVLWRTAGTESNTQVIERIPNLQYIYASDSYAFIAISDFMFTSSLKRSDGTTASTQDIPFTGFSLLTMEASGDKLFFTTQIDKEVALWILNPDQNTPQRLHTFVSPGDTSAQLPHITIKSVLDRVYLVVENEGQPTELWVSDGTETGTKIISTFDGKPQELTAIGADLYFFIDTSGYEIWKVNRSNETSIVIQNVQPVVSTISENGLIDFQESRFLFRPWNNSVAFLTRAEPMSIQLWISDGTTKGTHKVVGFAEEWQVSAMHSINQKLYIAFNGQKLVNDFGVPVVKLWASDGTEAGTELVQEFDGAILEPTTAGENLYFMLHQNLTDFEIYALNTTSNTVQSVFNSYPSTVILGRHWLTNHKGRLYFAAMGNEKGYELWTSNGKPENTHIVKDINDTVVPRGESAISSHPAEFTKIGQQVYFTADNGVDGRRLWQTDGTPSGTVLITETLVITGDIEIIGATDHMIFLLASETDAVTDYYVWSLSVSDRTPTFLTKHSNERPQTMAIVNGRLVYLFAGDYAFQDLGVWTSDGSPEGTRRVIEIDYFQESSKWISGAVATKDRYYFVANLEASGTQLWVTDGTASGTQLIKRIRTDNNTVKAIKMISIGDVIYFRFPPAQFRSCPEALALLGAELWRSDGTADGTILLHDFGCTYVEQMVTADNQLFVGVSNFYPEITELWQSDAATTSIAKILENLRWVRSDFPTASTFGVVPLSDGYLIAGTTQDGITLFEQVQLYFLSANGKSIRHMSAIARGDKNTYFDESIEYNQTYFLNIQFEDNLTGPTGYELWRSDGRLCALPSTDLNIGSSHNYHQQFAVLGQQLIMARDDGKSGSELWALNMSEPLECKFVYLPSLHRQ